MPQAIDEAGNVWEIDAQGNPVQMIKPAAQQGRVFSLSPNPKDVQQQRHQENIDARGERAQDRADTIAEVGNRLKEQEIQLARQKEEREGYTSKDIAGWRSNLNNIGLLKERVAKLRQLYNDEFKGKGPIKSALESYEPKGLHPAYGVFDTTGMQMLADMAKAKGLTSQQFNTPAEQKMFFEPLIPKRGDTDEDIVNKLDYLDKMISTGEETTKANLGLVHQRADNEVPDPTTGADLKPPPAPSPLGAPPPENATETTLPDGNKSFTYDERMSAAVDAMVNAGAPIEKINEALAQQSFGPISAPTYAAARQWMEANPGKAYYGANIGRSDDLNLWQRSLANENVAPIAAGVTHAADMGTGGLVSLAAGEKGRGALDASARLYPTASTIGEIAGGVTGALGAEAAVAAKAPVALARYAPRIADALYGGAVGFNTAREGEGGAGALKGAGAGLLGSYLGTGAGKALRGVSDPAVRALRSAGVPLTIGQIVGKSGLTGRTVKGIEDRLTGFPLVGDVVNARRTEGVEAIADRMANDAVAPIGGTASGYGQGTVDDILQQGSDAYGRATAGAHVPLDPQFGTDMKQIRAKGRILPDDLSARFSKAIDNRVAPVEADTFLTGDSFQQAVRGLKGYRSEMTKPGFEQDYRDALGSGIGALRDQMNRGGGQDVVDNLANADQAWRQIKIVQKATEAARNGARSGEVGLPMPSHFNDAALASSTKYGGSRFNGPLLDSAQQVLPSKVGDSGTAGRWATGLMLGGAGMGAGGVAGGDAGGVGGALGGATAGGLGTVLLLAAGGSKPAQRMAAKMLADRPDIVARLGEQVVRHGGWTGAGALTPLFVEP